MKVKFECIECIIKRLVNEIALATQDEELRFNSLKSILKEVFKELELDSNPANIGTLKDKLIKKTTGNNNYYRVLKESANKKALELTKKIRENIINVPDEYKKFRLATLSAIAGNSMEFFVLGNDFKINQIENILKNTEKELIVDDINKFYFLIKKKGKILYLIDNAGEIAFDTLLVEQIVNLGAKVYVAVKENPVMNDATRDDAIYVGMHKFATKVITTGSDSIGLIPSDCSDKFLKYLDSADLVISKGMGYYETLGELKLEKPIMILLRSKCMPVANDLKVPQNKNVAKLIYSTNTL